MMTFILLSVALFVCAGGIVALVLWLAVKSGRLELVDKMLNENSEEHGTSEQPKSVLVEERTTVELKLRWPAGDADLSETNPPAVVLSSSPQPERRSRIPAVAHA